MNGNWGMAWINTQTRLVLLIKFIPLKDIPDYRYLLIIKVARNSSSQRKHKNHVTSVAISLRSNLELHLFDKSMPRSLRKRSSRKSYSEDVFAGIDSSEESEGPGPGSTSALQQSSKSKIGVDSADDEDDDEYSFSAEDDAEVETENDDHDGENFEIDDIAIENKEIQSDTTHHELLDVPNDSNGALNSHSVGELEMYKENEQALADLIRTIEEHFQANVFELKDVIVGSFNGDGKTQDSTTVHITKTVKKRGRPRKYPISNTSTKEPSKSEAILPAPTSVSSSPLAPSESHTSLPEKQKHLVFPVDNTGKLTCPVQACKKVFASKAGFVYHLRNTPHNFLDFLAHAFPNSRIDAVSNTSNVMNKISSNPNSTEPLSIIATLPSTSILSNIEPSIVHMLLLVPIISYPLKVNTPPAVMPPPHGTSAKAVSYEVLFDIPDLPEDVVEPFKVLLEKPEYSSLKFYIEGQSVEAVIGESKYQTRNLRHAAERKSNRSTDQSKASLPHKPRGKPSRSKQPFSGQRNAELMCDCIDFPKPSDALKKPFWQLFESNPRLKEFKEDCKLKLRTDDIKILTKEERERASKMWTPRKVEVRNKSGIESRITEVGCMQSEQLPPSCSKGFLLNTGSSVWGLDWCPGVPSGAPQYLAVSSYPTKDTHIVMGRKYQPSTGIIQIWHLGDGVTNSSIDSEMQKPKLDLCLVHEWGACLDLKWWPIGLYHDPRTNATTSNENGTSDGQLNEELGSIGILGGTFADGSLRLFVVPHPERVREKLKVTSDNEPCFVRIKKVLLDATLPDSTYSKFNFGGLFRIAVGASNGFISIFSLLSASNTSTPKPEIYFPAHDSCVRDIFFGHGGSPSEGNQLISCGLDGKLLFWDLRDLFVPVQLHRTRAFLMSCNWPVSFDVWVLADSENTVRYMRFSGDEVATHVLLGHKGCVWSLATSLYHPFLASASADGSVRVINLNKGRSRLHTPVYNTLYELDYDQERQLLKMTDAVGTEESKANAHKQESQYVQYFPSEAAVQKVVWSTNPQSSCWLTSGGTEGIVRIEMVGRD